jgi:hypothetical protein
MGVTDFPVRSPLLVALLATAIVSSQLIPNCFAGRASRPSSDNGAPTKLAAVKATASDRGVLIEWRTGFEIDNLGFNIFRERNGRREKINRGIIAGSALIVGPGTVLDAGFSYSWFDPSGSIDCKYYLTDINLSGIVNSYPAVKPEFGSNSPVGQQSELLSGLGARADLRAAQSEWSERSNDKSQSTSAEVSTAGTIADQWAIADQPALKVGVRSDGWYRITQPEMAAAGFNTAADARNLRMFVNATEIAIRVSRQSGGLTSVDFIEFWGEGLDTASTDTRIYWLVNGVEAGKRILPVGDLRLDLGRGAGIVTLPMSPLANFSGSWFPGITGGLPVTGAATSSTEAQSSDGNFRKPTVNEYLSNAGPSNYPIVQDSPVEPDSRNSALNSFAADYHRGTELLAQTRDSTSSPINTAGIPRPSTAPRLRHKRPLHNSRRFRPGRNRFRSSRARHNHAGMNATPAAPAFICNVQRKDRTIYFAAALNGPAENFFGEILASDPPPLTLTVHDVEATSTLSVQLQISLRGVTAQDHQITVSVNGALVGSMLFFGQNPAIQNFSLPLSALVEGDNVVKLVPTAAGQDVSIVDYVRLTYPRSFKANNDSLQFTIKATQSPRIEGFTTPNIRMLDITDSTAVKELDPIIESNGAEFAATVSPGSRGKARRIVALPEPRISHPASLILNQSSTLNQDSNAADLLIISYRDFMPALAPLVTQRHDRDGFTVKVVDIEDVYDEFSYGSHSPQAIKDFLSLASSKWAKAPRYLLLVGDASYDPRNYMGNGSWDFVPSMHVDTLSMEADSDDSLGDFDNDGVPELAIGRLPARSVSEANIMVSKIVNFTPADVPQSALMVADNPVGYDFEAFDEHLITLLPASMSVQRVYRSSDAAPRDDIITKINQGVALVNYSGHGNIDIWAGPIFDSGDALALTNGKHLPFVTVMDCLNGFFSDPLLEGLAESLLKAPNGGAIASFASSGLTSAIPQHEMGERMFQLLYGSQSMAIGDASRQAKSATQDIDVRRTWILFGDPTMKVR